MIYSPAGQEAASELRVILVGQTGLDAALRRDPAIELIRSRSPLDAIGELADPIDDTSPTRSVVIVAPESDRPDASHVRQFIDGLRLIDPHVRILRISNGTRSPDAALFDAEVSKDDAPEDLLAVIRGHSKPRLPARVEASAPAPLPFPARTDDSPQSSATSANASPSADSPQASDAPAAAPAAPAPLPFTTPAPASKPTYQPAPTPAPVAAASPRDTREPDADPDHQLLERKPARLGIGDEHLASEIIRGRDPRSLALDILRARLGNRAVELVAPEPRAGTSSTPGQATPPQTALTPGASAPGPGAAAEPARPEPTHPQVGATRALVRWGEHTYGTLTADNVPPADLQRHADWLASWLRLGDQHKELREDAYRDPLTGAWNRRYFDRFFAAALAKSRDGRHNLTLLVFDIDDFKIYNDKYGHSAGDDILIETVRLLQSTVRPTDRVCRIGGDEFAVVFYEPTGPRETGSRHPTSFFDIAKRFQKQVWEHRFPKLGEQAPGTLTVSGGLATYPWDGTTPQELLERADKLALDSKRLGKNAITLGPGSMRACNGAGKPPKTS